MELLINDKIVTKFAKNPTFSVLTKIPIFSDSVKKKLPALTERLFFNHKNRF